MPAAATTTTTGLDGRQGIFEGVSDVAFEAELRASGLLLTGSGGHGPRGPERSGGGGGGGEDGDEDEEWPRRHHSPTVRVLALVAVSCFMVGTVGGWISLAVEGSRPAFPAVVGDAGVAGPARSGRVVWRVSLEVANHSGADTGSVCVVFVDAAGHRGTANVALSPMEPGQAQHRLVPVTVPGASPAAGVELATACGPR